MPSLDEISLLPAVEAAVLATGDKLIVLDVSTGKLKSITAGELLEQAVGLLPTSASGLSTGDLYLNSGVLTQVS